MMTRKRSCALAVVLAALWTATEARGEGNALWQLSEEERYNLLKLAGGMDDAEDKRLREYFESSAGRPLNWGSCRRYVGPEPLLDDPGRRDACLREFPPMVLKRIHSYGYKKVKLSDVADLATFSFYEEMLDRFKKQNQGQLDEYQRRYMIFKKRLGVFTTHDRALEDSLNSKKYIIRRKR